MREFGHSMPFYICRFLNGGCYESVRRSQYTYAKQTRYLQF